MTTNLSAGDRIRVTHTTGIVELATIDRVNRNDPSFPAVMVTYDDGTNGRIDLRATIERLPEACPRTGRSASACEDPVDHATCPDLASLALRGGMRSTSLARS